MTASRTPPTARPTNAQLQTQIAEVHDCIHNVGEEVKALSEVVRKDRAALDALVAQQSATDARVELLVKFFGLRTPQNGEEPRRRVTLNSLEWWQAVLGIGGSVLGALSAWKYLFPALVALHHAILTAG